MHYRNFTLAVLLVFSLFWILPSQAQTNLLQNGGFENAGQYQRASAFGRADFTFASGWDGWHASSPRSESWMNLDPIAFPHSGSSRHNGLVSQNIGRGSATFTAAAFQVVNNIPEGTKLRFEAWVFQQNDAASGARTRVGIGSNVGGNPLAGTITWSPFTSAVNSWQTLSVEATVPAGSVTVFIYSTQTTPHDPNQVYYDDAVLSADGLGTPNIGSGNATNTPSAPPTNTPQPFAPFVNPQQGDATGRIEHIVQAGDTLAAIAVAYGVPIAEIRALNNIQGSIINVGQKLLIQEASAQPPTVAATNTTIPSPTSESGAVTGDGFISPTPLTVAEVVTNTPTTEAAIAQVVSPTATEQVLETITETPTEATPDASPTPSAPTFTPTATLIPATPTDAPTAPVETGTNTDPLNTTTAVCVLMFEDKNQNNIMDGEPLLAGGTISLRPSNGTAAQDYVTDGTSEPFCFDNLEMGNYTVSATAPDGYGIVRSSSLVVNVQVGQQFPIRFAAAVGLQTALVPTADGSSVTDTTTPLVEEEADATANLRNVAGIIVIGLAAVVLVAGLGIAFIASRR